MGGVEWAASDPEVQIFSRPPFKDEQVGGFEVTVDDVTGVCGLECFGRLDGERNGRIDGQAGGCLGQHRPQIAAVQQFHDDKQLPIDRSR